MLPIPQIPNNRTSKSNPTKTGKSSGGDVSESLRSGDLSHRSSVASENFRIENTKPDFLELLEAVAPMGKPNTRDVNLLWKELPGLEREVIETKSIPALERYKNQIKLILTAILEKNTGFQKLRTPIRHSSSHKEYTVVEHIDNKLKILAETITDPRNTAFQILKQMDTVRGLLLDINL